MKSLINNHNQNIIQDQPQLYKKEDSPMNGLVVTESFSYYVKISCQGNISPNYRSEFAKTLSKTALQTTKKYFNVKDYKNNSKLSTLETNQFNPKVS